MSSTRLYIEGGFAETLIITGQDYHHLCHVMRKKIHDTVNIFNGNQGEYQAVITEITKNHCCVKVIQQIRKAIVEPLTRLIYSPLKPDALKYIHEKGTELGVTDFVPMIMNYTQHHEIHKNQGEGMALDPTHKTYKHLKSAIQQCERLSLPRIYTPQPLVTGLEILKKQDPHSLYLAALERCEQAPPVHHILKPTQASVTAIIGPEGGFSPRERAFLLANGVQPMTLGHHILRADTAAICVLSLINDYRNESVS